MTRILVYPERLTDVGRRFISDGEHIAQIGQGLSGAVGGLDWESRARIGMEDDFAAARARAEGLGQQLISHGQRLIEIAERFERADNEAAQDAAAIPWTYLESTVLRKVSEFADEFDRAKDSAKGAVEILASIGLAAGLVKGGTYAGQVIFHGGRDLKNLAGVSPYLTHIKDVRIPSHLAEAAFKGKFKGKLGAGSILLEGLSEVGENWEEYGGDIPKVVTGIVVDTLIGIGGAAVGAGVGAFVFGTVGGLLLGPAGAVIGGKVGGVIGSIAGEWVAEKVEDIKIGDRKLDQAVVETVTGGIQASAQAVDHALSSFVEDVARLF